MFQSIVNRAQRSADTLISKYVTRVAVAVPFVIAVGFGTAAASVALTEMYGTLAAHAVLAAAFVLVGLAAAAAIAVSGSSNVAADAATLSSEQPGAEHTDAPTGKTDTLDPEMLLAAIGTIGPVALPALIRIVARNVPLIIGALVLAYLLFSDVRKSESKSHTASNA